jgi:16S rRNA (guanine527-N7)-methyltransferase
VTTPTGELDAGLDERGIDLPAGARATLLRHLDLVRERNRSVNLTRITDPLAMVRDHVLDSLAALPVLENGGRLLDLGSGAGFPGIPLAIARPDLEVLLVESRGKKAAFLEDVAHELELANVTVFAQRARELHHVRPDLAGTIDVVTARAVASLEKVLREVKGLVVPGGVVVHFKGPGLDDAERAAGDRAASRFGFDPAEAVGVQRPGTDRQLILHRRRPAG